MSVLLLLVVTDGAVERQRDDDCVLEIIEQAIVYAFDRLTATDLPHDYGGDTGVIIAADGIHEMVYAIFALIGLYREHDMDFLRGLQILLLDTFESLLGILRHDRASY
jgi:hypothetical protein